MEAVEAVERVKRKAIGFFSGRAGKGSESGGSGLRKWGGDSKYCTFHETD